MQLLCSYGSRRGLTFQFLVCGAASCVDHVCGDPTAMRADCRVIAAIQRQATLTL